MAEQSGPMILCGPIVRRAAADTGVSVFVVTREACALTLMVGDSYDAMQDGHLRAMGTRRTARIGQGLHLAVVTAEPVGEGLAWGETYPYDLVVEAGDFKGGLSDADVLVKGPTGYAQLSQRLVMQSEDLLPCVALPPDDPSQLRVLTGSCRKPHGKGRDAMVMADKIILSARVDKTGAKAWPHQLILSGDQIYADDVHPHMLGEATRLGGALLGDAEYAALGAVYTTRLRHEHRKSLVQRQGGLTTGARGHLITLAEFCGMYLLGWSDQVWSKRPTASEVGQHVLGFYDELGRARRVLANVATYMMFDDHEITDDWALRAQWNAQVLSSSLGRRIVRNGLVAYALFQHWGNVPLDFEGDGPGAALLDLLEGVDGGIDEARLDELDRLLGIPPADATDHAAWGDQQAGEAMAAGRPLPFRWSYSLEAPGYRLVALDGRTRRQFVDGGVTLMSRSDINDWLPTRAGAPGVALQVAVAPAPVLGLKLIEGVQGLMDGSFDQAVKLDAEPWSVSPTLNHLLRRVLDGPPTVILSGDVHYGFASVVDGRGGRAVNLVASALKNDGMGSATAWFIDGDELQSTKPESSEAKPILNAAQREIEDDGEVFTVALLDGDGEPAAADAFTLQNVGERTRSPLVAQDNLGEVLFDVPGRITLRLHYRVGDQDRQLEQTPKFKLGER